MVSFAAQISQAAQNGQLATWATLAQQQWPAGQVNQRIGLLAQADARWFAVQIETATGDRYTLGDPQRRFALMSVVKPFLMLYILEQLGWETLRQHVDVRPSEAPFNSLTQLQADGGRPRNPMINSGAITLADLMPGNTGQDRCDRLCQWLNHHTQSQLTLDTALLDSVAQAGREPNLALVACLQQTGQLRQPPIALEAYERICCLAGTVADLAQLGRLLAFGSEAIAYGHRCAVNATILTCGLYEASPEATVTLGLPIKSGISGALLAIAPGQGAIATYSPALDPTGNPVAGLAFVETLAKHCQISIFA